MIGTEKQFIMIRFQCSCWALTQLPTDCSAQSGGDRSHHDDINQACSQYPKVTREIKNLTVKIMNQEMTELLCRDTEIYF